MVEASKAVTSRDFLVRSVAKRSRGSGGVHRTVKVPFDAFVPFYRTFFESPPSHVSICFCFTRFPPSLPPSFLFLKKKILLIPL